MSFLGKVYTYERQEKFDEFLKAIGLPEGEIAKYLQYSPTTQLDKDGDTYTYTSVSASGTKVTKFKSGVEFDDTLPDGTAIKTKYTVDGNKVTQSISSPKGSGTFVREYTDDTLVVTITSSAWDDTAKRYYKA